jgi:hypothetical protein
MFAMGKLLGDRRPVEHAEKFTVGERNGSGSGGFPQGGSIGICGRTKERRGNASVTQKNSGALAAEGFLHIKGTRSHEMDDLITDSKGLRTAQDTSYEPIL